MTGTKAQTGPSSRVAVAWNELPFYAARLIREGIERVDVPAAVLGSRPSVPIKGVEEALGHPIRWIDNEVPQSWSELEIPVPGVFVHTGWRYTGFNTLAREVRREGGAVVSMIDHRWKNSFVQWMKALVFRLRYRGRFEAVWVPGKSGRRLCRFLGMPDGAIYEGMYGADPEVFPEGPPLFQRDKTMLFVGQFIPRKNVRLLVEAFRRFHRKHPEWTLRLVGEGEETVPRHDEAIEVEGFLQPEEVAEAMRRSRFLVLPSEEDHWGLVVHEAALSGCGLIVSENVGAAPDLVTPENGIVHQTESVDDLAKAMCRADAKDREWLADATEESRKLAAEFGPGRWADAFESIVAVHGR